ncbi:conjugal transfer protein TraG N-terminal domain-containing protein [Desulfurobacterium sp. TC5-1]|uniref:conjugal transfer protein TraG N-terminal domain-containing protein n=1 Tax=Desulfurobacterium sp. TC5-1 TaxID=1158318 RepID=UPI0003B6BF08|nr:conjugal transfer protein TraG N-terminal domain-containing protein [Desulfurobacterium sp. TC5-1]
MKRKNILFFVLLLVAVPHTAMAVDTIYTWGYGDLIAEALRGVISVVGSGDFHSLFKVFMGLAVFSSVFSVLFSIGKRVDYFSIFKVGIVGSIVFSLLIQIRVPVAVEDLVNGSNEIINNVPWIIARPLALFTQTEKVLGGVAERSFLPFSAADLSYNNVGPIAPLAVVASEVQATRPVDPYIYKSVNNYVEDCVIPDILDGTKSLTNLQTSTTLWTELGGTNPARFTVIYDASDPEGTVYSCDSAYGILTGQLNTYVNTDALDVLSKSIGFLSAAKIASVLGIANDYFMNYSTTAQDAILQGIAINQMKDGYREWAIAAGVNPDALAYSLSTATEQLKQTSLAKAITGAKFLPMAKGVATAFFVAMLPFVLLVGIFGGEKVFKTIFVVYAWFLLWHIGEVVLNAFILNSARDYLSAIANGGFTLLNSAGVAAAAQDKIIAFSSFYWLIPTVSFGLAAGSAYAFTNVASGLMGMAAGAAERGAGEAARGSASFGNVAYNNVSSNNVDWLHRENMGFENRLEAGSMNVNGRQSFNTPWHSWVSEGGEKTTKLAGHYAWEAGLGKLGSLSTERFIDGYATRTANGGMKISGMTETGKVINGAVDRNGNFTGTISDGRGFEKYDKGQLIMAEHVNNKGFNEKIVGDTEIVSKGGAGVTALKSDGTITNVNLSNAAFKKTATLREQLSKNASEMEQRGKRAASDYIKTVGVDRAFGTSVRAIETVEEGNQYSDSLKKEARKTEQSVISKTLEDMVKNGVIKKDRLTAQGALSANAAVKGNWEIVSAKASAEGEIVKLKNKDNDYEVTLTGKEARAFREQFAKNFISSQSASRILKAARRGVKDSGYRNQFSEAQKWSESVSEYMQKAKEYREGASKISERNLSENLNALPEVFNKYLDAQGITDPDKRIEKAAEIMNNLNKLFATNPEEGLKVLNRVSGGDFKALENIEKMKVDPEHLGTNINTSKIGNRPDVKRAINAGKGQVEKAYNSNHGKDAGRGYEALESYKDKIDFGHVASKEGIEAARNLLVDSFNRWGLLGNDEGKVMVLGWNNDAMRIHEIRDFVPNKMMGDILNKMQDKPDRVVDSINRKELLGMKPGEVIRAKNGEKIAKITPGVYLGYNSKTGYFAFRMQEKPMPEYVVYRNGKKQYIPYSEWKGQGAPGGKPEAPPEFNNPKDLH